MFVKYKSKKLLTSNEDIIVPPKEFRSSVLHDLLDYFVS